MYARYPMRFSSIAWKVIQAMLENLRGYLAYIDWYGDVPLFWVPFLGCLRIFGYLFRLFPDFWVSLFLVQFDFFSNNPHFWVLILIFLNGIVECCLQGSRFLFSSVRSKSHFLRKSGNLGRGYKLLLFVFCSVFIEAYLPTENLHMTILSCKHSLDPVFLHYSCRILATCT